MVKSNNFKYIFHLKQSEFSHRPHLHNVGSYLQKHRKFEVAVGKEEKNHKVFLYLYAS